MYTNIRLHSKYKTYDAKCELLIIDLTCFALVRCKQQIKCGF